MPALRDLRCANPRPLRGSPACLAFFALALAACPAAADDELSYCERAYQDLIDEHGQDHLACLSQVNVDATSCAKPADPDKPAENPAVLIALDASGSMAGKVQGGQKMAVAKNALTRFVNTLPESTSIGLVAYGHKGSNTEKLKPLSCEGVELMYPIKKLDRAEFLRAVDSFKPTGWTPIAGALKKTQEVLAGREGAATLVYVVSDGIETCAGDPVAAASELHDSKSKAIVNVIGFDVDSKARRQLQAVAAAGGGQYFEARDADEINRVLDSELKSLAIFNNYVLCMMRNQDRAYFLYTKQQTDINWCLTKSGHAEYRALNRAMNNWFATGDPRKKCIPSINARVYEKQLRLKAWKNELNRTLQVRKDTIQQALDRELKEALAGREQKRAKPGDEPVKTPAHVKQQKPES